jgi:hypothetical protein
MANTIFDKKTIIQYEDKSKSLDNVILNSDEEKIFNTYRYWDEFSIPLQNIIKDGYSKDSKGDPITVKVTTKATKSLFNNFNAVLTNEKFRLDANMPLLDSPSNRIKQNEYTKCTIKDLVEASREGIMGRQVYNYSDFAYCKHLGKLSNNYLITLRRFGIPCGDKIDYRGYMSEIENSLQKHQPDIGRMVTWMGTPGNEMSNILKYTYGMQWEDQEAKLEDVQGQGEGTGPLASIFNMSNANYRKQVQQGYAGNNFAGKQAMDNMIGGFGEPPYNISDFQKANDSVKIYGPIDVIDKTKKRKRGLSFEQKFTLTFDYELRSYYGVNGKSAMLDLLGNILATTYTHGTFWGGDRRFIGKAQDNIFANLPIFKLSNRGGLNDPGAVVDALMESIDQGAKAFSGGVKGDSTKEKIINLAKDMGGMLLGGLLNKLGRPQKYAMASLISGAPVGCWHLTVGNPKSPILEVGNLICTGSEIEHYGPLGLDDFPTGIRVKVNLEHGQPRDIMGIEQMYGRGDTRIYAPLGKNVMLMYEKATPANTVSSALNKTANSLKNNTNSTIDKIDTPINSETKTDIPNIKPSTDITSLKRYFGTEEKQLIVNAGGEALFGNEKRKNNHMANK